MKKELLKKIAIAVAAGSVVAGGYTVQRSMDGCEYTIVNGEKKICIDAEVKEAIESGLQPNPGFGGVRFGGR